MGDWEKSEELYRRLQAERDAQLGAVLQPAALAQPRKGGKIWIVKLLGVSFLALILYGFLGPQTPSAAWGSRDSGSCQVEQSTIDSLRDQVHSLAQERDRAKSELTTCRSGYY